MKYVYILWVNYRQYMPMIVKSYVSLRVESVNYETIIVIFFYNQSHFFM